MAHGVVVTKNSANSSARPKPVSEVRKKAIEAEMETLFQRELIELDIRRNNARLRENGKLARECPDLARLYPLGKHCVLHDIPATGDRVALALTTGTQILYSYVGADGTTHRAELTPRAAKSPIEIAGFLEERSADPALRLAQDGGYRA